MPQRIASPVLHLVALALIMGLSGCVPLATDVRKEGFRSFDHSFANLDDSPALNEVIDLGGVKVHIVGHRQFFNYKKAAAYGCRGARNRRLAEEASTISPAYMIARRSQTVPSNPRS